MELRKGDKLSAIASLASENGPRLLRPGTVAVPGSGQLQLMDICTPGFP